MKYSAVDLIEDAARDDLYRAGRLASELWPVLQHHLSELSEWPRLMVIHYRDHLKSCPGAKEGCGGCRESGA